MDNAKTMEEPKCPECGKSHEGYTHPPKWLASNSKDHLISDVPFAGTVSSGENGAKNCEACGHRVHEFRCVATDADEHGHPVLCGCIHYRVDAVPDLLLQGHDPGCAHLDYRACNCSKAAPQAQGKKQQSPLDKWDEVEKQCLAFIEHPGEPSVAAIHWCVSLIQERRDALAVQRTLERERDELRKALIRLRDCDWVITPADRMDAVRQIARDALSTAVPVVPTEEEAHYA